MAIWLPDPRVRGEREQARFRMHLVKHRSMLKNRVHSVLINGGKPCPVSDLFGVEGRRLLDELQVPEPWRGSIDASLLLIDAQAQIAKISGELRATGVEHRYTPLLTTAPGIGWVLGYTIGAETGEIERFSSPKKLVGYTGLCPRVYQSGEKDRRGPLTKAGPKYLRWACSKRPCTPAATPFTATVTWPPSGALGASAARRSPKSIAGVSHPRLDLHERCAVDGHRAEEMPQRVKRQGAEFGASRGVCVAAAHGAGVEVTAEL
ncbi:MAG: transposase [Actinomycetota bacterium]|nr:transposase [Actinomycetota bacterium]